MDLNGTSFLNYFNIGTITQVAEVLALVFFLIYALFSIKEVNMMNKALGTPLAPKLQMVARIQVYAALIALAFFIIVLVVK